MSDRSYEKRRIYESIEVLQTCLAEGLQVAIEDFLVDLLAVVEEQMDLIEQLENQCDNNYERIVDLEDDVRQLEER